MICVTKPGNFIEAKGEMFHEVLLRAIDTAVMVTATRPVPRVLHKTASLPAAPVVRGKKDQFYKKSCYSHSMFYRRSQIITERSAEITGEYRCSCFVGTAYAGGIYRNIGIET